MKQEMREDHPLRDKPVVEPPSIAVMLPASCGVAGSPSALLLAPHTVLPEAVPAMRAACARMSGLPMSVSWKGLQPYRPA